MKDSLCWDCDMEIFKKCKWAHGCISFDGLKFGNKTLVKKCPNYVKEKPRKIEGFSHCIVCGKELHGAQKFYCSPDCIKYGRLMEVNYCAQCGKEIPHRYKYCSEDCKIKYNIKIGKRRPERKCLYCGKVLKIKGDFCNGFCKKLYFDERERLKTKKK